jgi:hypothetical protein
MEDFEVKWNMAKVFSKISHEKENLTLVRVKIYTAIFCIRKPCSLVDRYERLRYVCSNQPQKFHPAAGGTSSLRNGDISL